MWMNAFFSSYSPSWVQAPRRFMIFLCFPIIFIISISDTRSERSFSVASSRTLGKLQISFATAGWWTFGWNRMKLNFWTRKRLSKSPLSSYWWSRKCPENCPPPCQIANLGSIVSKVKTTIYALGAKANSFPANLTDMGAFFSTRK